MSTQSLILDYSKLEKTKLNLINKGTLSPFKNKIKYKFYNIHLKKIKELKKINEKKQKKEAIYKPNLEYIYNKSSSGPEWKIISGRKEKLFENSGNLLDIFYNYKTTTFYETKKSFINMSKQTNRKDLINDKKLKNKNQSKFSLNRRSLKSISDKKKKEKIKKEEKSENYESNIERGEEEVETSTQEERLSKMCHNSGKIQMNV